MQAHSLSLKLACDPEKLKRLTGARFGYVGDRPLDDGSPVSDNIYTGPGLYELGVEWGSRSASKRRAGSRGIGEVRQAYSAAAGGTGIAGVP